MGSSGLGKKLAFAAVAVGALLVVLRIVGGRDAEGIDERGIDRVDTGKSADDEDGEGGPVETGLERVSTSDDGDESDETDEERGSDEIDVEATGGRFDDLDLFDIVAIAGAGFEAAREEYRSRT